MISHWNKTISLGGLSDTTLELSAFTLELRYITLELSDTSITLAVTLESSHFLAIISKTAPHIISF